MGQRGIGVRAIARTLERAPSTISREFARNTNASQDYGSHHAQLRAAASRRHTRGAGKGSVALSNSKQKLFNEINTIFLQKLLNATEPS